MSKIGIETLRSFSLTRVLNSDPQTRTIWLLGTLDNSPSIITLKKTPFNADEPGDIMKNLECIEGLGGNDIYHWMMGWSNAGYKEADWKIDCISPCTEVHIAKYSKQNTKLIKETPELFKAVVQPFIISIPSKRTQWVRNILNHVTEAEHIVFEDPDPTNGFILVPDLKWDQKTINSLYLTAISHAPIPCLRSLRATHLPLLRSIRSNAQTAANTKYGVDPSELRLFIHYQPSYYHFHVHVTHLSFNGGPGMSVGQAHLLDDVISLLEIDGDIFEKMTLSYVLGENHGLFAPLMAAISSS